MYECETCVDTFYYWSDAEDHMDNYGHWPECETCNRTFRTMVACRQHMNAVDHWAPRFDCETCDQKFRSMRAAEQHMAAKGHYRNYCRDCDRHFQNANNLKMHLNSKVHRGTSLSCPFCAIKYTSATGLTHHLERGACVKAPFLNRETIWKLVRRQDPNGIITNKQIEWHKEQSCEYEVTGEAHNGQAWECYLCHKEFRQSIDLTRHLNSNAHKQRVYHCPNYQCHKEFITLAALFNHLESEACQFMKFAKVQEQVHGIVTGQRRIGF